MKILNNKNWLLIIRQLLNEGYLLVLFVSLGFAISEIIIPGFISQRINYSTIYLLLFFSSAILYIFNKHTANILPSSEKVPLNKKTLFGLCVFATLFMAIDLKSVSIFLFIPMAILLLFSVHYLVRYILED